MSYLPQGPTSPGLPYTLTFFFTNIIGHLRLNKAKVRTDEGQKQELVQSNGNNQMVERALSHQERDWTSPKPWFSARRSVTVWLLPLFCFLFVFLLIRFYSLLDLQIWPLVLFSICLEFKLFLTDLSSCPNEIIQYACLQMFMVSQKEFTCIDVRIGLGEDQQSVWFFFRPDKNGQEIVTIWSLGAMLIFLLG